jgi:hypothetical protein
LGADLRTALVLTGLLRDFERAAPNLRERVIERYSIKPEDIYISVWSDRGYWYPGDAAESKSFLESGKVQARQIESIYPNSQIDLENFEEKKDFFNALLEAYPEVYIPSIDHSNYIVRGINLVSMLYKMSRGLQLAVSNPRTTHIVRTRPDLVVSKNLPSMPKRRLVVAKQSSHLGLGIGDNLHIGPIYSHVPIMNALENLPNLFERTGGVLCPHLMMQVALDASRVPFVQKRIPFETLHTPGGMYAAQEKDGSWKKAKEVDYERSNRPFRGSPGA